jgi:hypothetical protein
MIDTAAFRRPVRVKAEVARLRAVVIACSRPEQMAIIPLRTNQIPTRVPTVGESKLIQ